MLLKQVQIRIRTPMDLNCFCVLDPDGDLYGECGSGSTSLEMYQILRTDLVFCLYLDYKNCIFVTFQSGQDPNSHGSALVLLPQSGSVSAFSEKDPSGSALKNMRIHNTDLMPASILETLEPSLSSGYTDESQQFDDSQPESHSVLGKKNTFYVWFWLFYTYLTNCV